MLIFAFGTFTSLGVNYFQINFPSGTRIQVQTGIAHMDLDVQAPPDDFKAAEGLCGNWNGVEGGALRGGDGHLYTLTTVTNFTKSWQYGFFT